MGLLRRVTNRFKLKPYEPNHSTDPEAAGHVVAMVQEAFEQRLSTETRLRELPHGATLLKNDPPWNRRVLRALLEALIHWDQQYQQIERQIHCGRGARKTAERPEVQRLISHLIVASNAVEQLCRRQLHLSDAELVRLAQTALKLNHAPLQRLKDSTVVKQFEYAAKARALSVEANAVLAKYSQVASGRWQHRLNQLIHGTGERDSADQATAPSPPPVLPVEVGNSTTSTALKRRLGIPISAPRDVTAEQLEPDHFHLRTDSPLMKEHRLVSQLLQSCLDAPNVDIDKLASTVANFKQRSKTDRGRFLLAVTERLGAALLNPVDMQGEARGDRSDKANAAIFAKIAASDWHLDRGDLFDALLVVSAGSYLGLSGWKHLARPLGHAKKAGDWTIAEAHVLHRLRCLSAHASSPVIRQALKSIRSESSDIDRRHWLIPGEIWADRIHGETAEMDEDQRSAWYDLIQHAAAANASKPSKQWRKQAASLIDAIGENEPQSRLHRWLSAVGKGYSVTFIAPAGYEAYAKNGEMHDSNATVLRGLVWLLTQAPNRDSPRVIADLLLVALKRIPGIGPRSVKLANACTWALNQLATAEDQAIQQAVLSQLARLRTRVTYKPAARGVEQALEQAAEQAQISRDELEELGLPNFGFEHGVLRQTFGDAMVELRVEGAKVVTQWYNEKGKAVKSVPAAVKRGHADAVKQIKQTAKDAEQILSATQKRLDTIYLQNKSWSFSQWRLRYLDHGLIGPLTRRLIWLIDDTPAMFLDDQPVDVTGQAVAIKDDPTVTLWHPVGRDTDEVLAWRQFVEDRRITQPFKQAHREVYLLTDAERQTRLYSNRFAAHVLKQHQFNALCHTRGWDSQLRLMVDDEYPPPSRELPEWGLRAEFWVEGAGDTYGIHTNESYVFLYLTTEQVRFYPLGAGQVTAHVIDRGYAWNEYRGEEPQPVPLEQVPPLVFSEIMRDVDLFVGVTSLGNDPSWSDGGPEVQYRAYWNEFGFGELTQPAQTRKQVLERLVPRLKIADRCSLEGRYLVVRGSIRTYRIHLNSGNVLMEPGNQYLCIMPKPVAVNQAGSSVFLPFEGDRTMSIILSKAFLLADDKNIVDETIVNQIKKR